MKTISTLSFAFFCFMSSSIYAEESLNIDVAPIASIAPTANTKPENRFSSYLRELDKLEAIGFIDKSQKEEQVRLFVQTTGSTALASHFYTQWLKHKDTQF